MVHYPFGHECIHCIYIWSDTTEIPNNNKTISRFELIKYKWPHRDQRNRQLIEPHTVDSPIFIGINFRGMAWNDVYVVGLVLFI
jgi:hypothetical protein